MTLLELIFVSPCFPLEFRIGLGSLLFKTDFALRLLSLHLRGSTLDWRVRTVEKS